MIVYRWKHVLTIKELWYSGEDRERRRADIVHYRYIPDPMDGAEEFTTIFIDLTKPEDRLLAEMKRNTRWEIKRAAEYGLRYEHWYPAAADRLGELVEFVNAANVEKGLPPTDERVLRAYASCGVLDVSRVSDRDSAPLIWRAHYRDQTHARPTHTASIFRTRPASERAFLGQANRWGYWEDMRRLRRDGIRIYDFGGWYSGTENEQLLRVNSFKEGFGGQIVKTYQCSRPETLFGRLYLRAARLRSRL